MKKLIFGGILAAMLGTGAFFASQKKQTSELSEIQMANIEALAGDETGAPGNTLRDKYCESFTNWICAIDWKIGNGETNTTYYFDYWVK